MVEQLFRGLLRIDRDLNVVPELAQNMNVSEDGLTYLFMIREDARWSDGEPVTARRLRLRLAAAARGGARSRPSCSTTSPRPRRSTTGRSSCACARRATTSPTCSPRTGPIRGRATAPSSSAPTGAARVARRQRPVRARRGRRGRRASSTANPHWRATSGNVGEVRIAFRERTRSAARRVAGRPPRRRCWRPSSTPRRRAGHGRRASAPALDHLPRPQRAGNEPHGRRPACAWRSPTPSIAPPLLAATRASTVAAGRGGLIPPAMPGHGETRGAGLRPRARAGAARRGGLSRTAPGCRSSSSLAQPWRPGDAARRAARRRRHPGPRRTCRRSSWGFAPTATPGSRRWHADYPDPDGFFLGLLRIEPLYRDDGDRRAAGRPRAPRATATSACACTASSSASGSGSARRWCRCRTSASSCCAAPTCRA